MRRRAFLQSSLGATTVSMLGAGGGRARTVGDDSRATQSDYEPLGSVDVPGAKEAASNEDGSVAYVAAETGFAAVDISDPANPAVLADVREFDTDSDLPHSDAPLEVIYDAWPDGDRLVVVGPASQAPGAAHGFALFDISDPANPEQVAWYATRYHIHNSYFVDDRVYLTGSGLRDKPVIIVDVSDDEPEELGRWSVADASDEWENVPITSRVLHDVYVRDDVAYLPFWDAGTWLVDVSDPAEPSVLSRVGDYSLADLQELSTREAFTEYLIPGGNAHYAQVNEDSSLLLVGREAWAGERDGETVGGPGGVDLWDISDKTDPAHLAHIEAPDSYNQTTSGWFTTAHNADIVGDRLYTSWYFGGVKVHDVSDPATPEELAWWRDPEEASFWTARSAVPGETFIASSANVAAVFDGRNGTREALYTFPDRAGTQEDAPDLTQPDANDTPEPTPTPTPEATPTPTPESTPTPTPESTPTPTPESTPTPEDGSGPGFTAGGALAGLGGAYYLLRKRLGDDE